MTSRFEALAPWIFTIALFATWELICRGFGVSQVILPAPSAIFAAAFAWSGRGTGSPLTTM